MTRRHIDSLATRWSPKTNRAIQVWRVTLAFAIAALWEILPRMGLLDPVFVPPPSRVLWTIAHEWKVSQLGYHTLLSTERALVGFGIASVIGTVLGLLIGGAWPRLAEAIEPLVELFAQANPVVLFHVVLLFFGLGESSKIFVITWMCTWPIMFSAIGGVRQVDSDLIRTTRSFGLSGWRLCFKCLVPAAVPSILTGMRLSGGYAFIMLVATEMMGTSSGLGWYVVQSQESYHAGRIFAGATIITALALLLDVALKRVEKKLIHWQPQFDERRVLFEDVAKAA